MAKWNGYHVYKVSYGFVTGGEAIPTFEEALKYAQDKVQAASARRLEVTYVILRGCAVVKTQRPKQPIEVVTEKFVHETSW